MTSMANLPVIVLAGGFGTRLRHIVQDVPKPMAPVNGRPFLEILLDYLIDEGIRQVILATGHQSDQIMDHFGGQYKSLTVKYSHEDQPLGTGGAIKQAFDTFDLDQAFVINGDTFFPVSLWRLLHFHLQFKADVTLAIKYLRHFDRYGTITWNAYNRIEAFHEKLKQEEGWINGGIYVIGKEIFSQSEFGNFSFEKDILESRYETQRFYGLPCSEYFIDIGIPDDYARFQNEHGNDPTHKKDKNRTLFIDRDGVINKRIPDNYVRNIADFQFLPGVKEAMLLLSSIYERTIVVTNQQGIGKGLMSEADLKEIHTYMTNKLAEKGVLIDAVLYCPKLASSNPADRKPNIGMALKAKQQFAQIDWSAATLIGDSTSDIEFGLRMGMKTILVGQKSNTNLAHVKLNDLSEYLDFHV